MSLDELKHDLNQSLKKRDALRVSTLRFLLSEVHNLAIAKYASQSEKKLNDSDILEVIKKQVKTHKESIEAFAKAGRRELVDKESGELRILEAFLPAEISDEELRKILEPIIATAETPVSGSGQDFGLLMREAMAKVAGKAGGARIAGMLKQMMGK